MRTKASNSRLFLCVILIQNSRDREISSYFPRIRIINVRTNKLYMWPSCLFLPSSLLNLISKQVIYYSRPINFSNYSVLPKKGSTSLTNREWFSSIFSYYCSSIFYFETVHLAFLRTIQVMKIILNPPPSVLLSLLSIFYLEILCI